VTDESVSAQALGDVFYDAIRRCTRLGYTPTYFLRMLEECGPREAARRLLSSSGTSDGFRRLYELGHLELTVEAIVLRDEFAALFTASELATARRRLDQLGFRADGV
jgi:hypothetical protein